jgi:hypothetical protein
MAATVGDLVFYRPYSKARENVPVLASAESPEQTGVIRVFPGDVLHIVHELTGGWRLARYPGVEGVLLVDVAYCEVWKRAERLVEV